MYAYGIMHGLWEGDAWECVVLVFLASKADPRGQYMHVSYCCGMFAPRLGCERGAAVGRRRKRDELAAWCECSVFGGEIHRQLGKDRGVLWRWDVRA